jgi:uncharacterized protein YyaL (SSP411 family)
MRDATFSRVVVLSGLLLFSGCAKGDPEESGKAALGLGERTAAAEAVDAQGERRANRLAHEKSPYLLQHAYNPVDWYPWGDEAFEKARNEDKPIFLSIGYSTCHWCHVMERESFESQAIAAFLNENFVAIKVDREERPDVDRVYMAFVQATTGSGGWPMSVWLTPDLKPFLGGTYFPPERRGNRPGFLELLRVVHDRWNNNRTEIVESSHRIVEQLQARSSLAHASAQDRVELSSAFITATFDEQKKRYDARHGGFGQAPKFPRPYELLFLHRAYLRNEDPEALEMSKATLLAMADGGIHDQLAGGLHRYSVDSMALIEVYTLSGEQQFAAMARSTLEYVQRDLTGKHGGFYSAEDADSAVDPAHPHEKEEGAFYVWTRSELDALLGPETAALAARHYGVRAEGNTGSRELRGKNVLYIAEPLAVSAESLGVSIDDAKRRLDEARAKLLGRRAERPRPHLDDKVLTAWNGLMISGFARAASVLGEDAYMRSARQAMNFVLDTLWDDKRQRLLRRFRDGEAAIDAFNVDYAYLVQGLLDLYEASFELRWFEWATKLTDVQIELFADQERGAFFESTGEDPSVYMRRKEDYGGAQPTSNSVTALNLLRLGEMTDSARYRALAQQTLQTYAPALRERGAALPAMLLALDFHQSSPRQIIVAGEPGGSDTRELLGAIYRRFLPNKVLLLADGGASQKKLAEFLPLIASLGRESGRATAYVCQNYACQLPVTAVDDLTKLVDEMN